MRNENLRYPVGHFIMPDQVDSKLREAWIAEIAAFPGKVGAFLKPLSGDALLRTYREGGWNIRQLVHHCADSHMNALIRVKCALTEVVPVIKPYEEDRWARLADGDAHSLNDSLDILRGVHGRWVAILRSLKEEDWNHSYFHPEKERLVSLSEATGSYAWHCRHHLAHMLIAAG